MHSIKFWKLVSTFLATASVDSFCRCSAAAISERSSFAILSTPAVTHSPTSCLTCLSSAGSETIITFLRADVECAAERWFGTMYDSMLSASARRWSLFSCSCPRSRMSVATLILPASCSLSKNSCSDIIASIPDGSECGMRLIIVSTIWSTFCPVLSAAT